VNKLDNETLVLEEVRKAFMQNAQLNEVRSTGSASLLDGTYGIRASMCRYMSNIHFVQVVQFFGNLPISNCLKKLHY
jgi:hypothetical protein